MGVTFAGGAMIGADTMRHVAENKASAGYGRKYFVFNEKVVIAKSGYGELGDALWPKLKQVVVKDAGPEEVASALKELGRQVYNACCAATPHLGPKFPGLNLIIAGISEQGPSLHWQLHGTNFFDSAYGPGRMISFGMFEAEEGLDNSQKLLTQQRCLKGDGRMAFRLDGWCRAVIASERAVAPYAVDFPGEMALVRNGKPVLEGEVSAVGKLSDNWLVHI